jgi:hypothetical protein
MFRIWNLMTRDADGTDMEIFNYHHARIVFLADEISLRTKDNEGIVEGLAKVINAQSTEIKEKLGVNLGAKIIGKDSDVIFLTGVGDLRERSPERFLNLVNAKRDFIDAQTQSSRPTGGLLGSRGPVAPTQIQPEASVESRNVVTSTAPVKTTTIKKRSTRANSSSPPSKSSGKVDDLVIGFLKKSSFCADRADLLSAIAEKFSDIDGDKELDKIIESNDLIFEETGLVVMSETEF